MCHVGAEICDHVADFLFRLWRIDGMQRQLRPGGYPTGSLEVLMRNKMAIKGGSPSTSVGHREERDLMPSRPHQVHDFKQVGFGPAELEVVLVAVQDPHRSPFRIRASLHVSVK